jgi:epoxyqueuosine reductase
MNVIDSKVSERDRQISSSDLRKLDCAGKPDSTFPHPALDGGFAAALKAKARELGFDVCRIARPDSLNQAPVRFEAWLQSGAAGDMTWLADKADRRKDPSRLWPEVVSILLVGMNYGPDEDPLATLARRSAANFSVYARNRDYHDLLKGRLKLLAGWLASQAAGTEVKVFVDTAPVLEKPLAQAAGLGWQGKHTNLVSRDWGSWLFLGAIFTTLELAPDPPEVDHCGSCTACLDICPTEAFPRPYVLDARRCISYLTIEHKGPIAAELRPLLGNRVYGCDDCLAVCPWNKFARVAHEAKLRARTDLRAPAIAELMGLEDAAFRRFFAGSAVKRIGIDRFMRNVLIAAGNSGDPTLAGAVAAKLASLAPLVRAMAVWALARLDPDRLGALEPEHRPQEADADVEAEWAAALDRGTPPIPRGAST